MKIFRENKYRLLSKIAKYSFIAIIAFTILMPVAFVSACGEPGGTPCPPAGDNNTNQIPAGDNNTGIKSGITNPLNSNLSDIPSFIEAVVNIVLLVGIPIVALAIIYSGFLFVTAQGNSEKLKKAKQTLLYTLIGAALLLGAFVIANAIKGTVEEIKSTT